MDYKISAEPPPVYERAKKEWGVDFSTAIFTYGDTIHSRNPLSDDLLAHELVHVARQTETGKDEWWDRYFTDPKFRLMEEVMAYQAQYSHLKQTVPDRNRLAVYLAQLARTLSGSMYGNIISYGEAIAMIRNGL